MQNINCVEVSVSKFAMAENMPPISEELFWAIVLACPKSGVILELGSGSTTGMIAEYRTIYSVEDNAEWLGKYNKRENYIYAPRFKNWYNVEAISRLPGYDVLFVDGPAHDRRMESFIENMGLFDTRAHWFFDDTDHAAFINGLEAIERKRGKSMIRFDKCYKQWGVILGD